MVFTDIENKKFVISTGNILNVNKKAGQKPAEELFDCLKATFDDIEIKSKSTIAKITRNGDDLLSKIAEHKREEIKVGAKVFINTNSVEYLETAIEQLLSTLDVSNLDNLILAYHPRKSSAAVVSNGTANHTPNGHGNNENGSAAANEDGGGNREGILEWGVGNKSALSDLKQLWNVLEKYATDKKICQLGISDLDTESLIELYESSTIKPTIAQINLTACCVVPPALQEFCNKNDIQLLTHSDPEEMLTTASLAELTENASLNTVWTSRYQVHVRCRGLLSAKGFIVGVERQ